MVLVNRSLDIWIVIDIVKLLFIIRLEILVVIVSRKIRDVRVIELLKLLLFRDILLIPFDMTYRKSDLTHNNKR